MNKSQKTATTIAVVVGVILGVIIYLSVATNPFTNTDDTNTPITSTTTIITGAKDARNATYLIDGSRVKLTNGVSVVDTAPGSASKITTRYFGNEVAHDLNGDGRSDIAFILTQNSGGSGTFYYAVAALNTVNGYVGSDGVLLGDRIAPQATNMGKGNIIIFNYADRRPGESFASMPSVGKSIWLLLDPQTMQFGEVAQNFAGEADPARMSLTQQRWNWISTTYTNATPSVTPRVTNQFSITFKADGNFSATTDCNGVGGEYIANGSKISLDKMMSTKMYCSNSQESEYSKMLSEIGSYHFTTKGELVFDLKVDGGVMVFK